MNASRFVLLGIGAVAVFAAGFGLHAWSSARYTPWAMQPPVAEPAASQLSQDDVALHRRGHYAGIDGIAQILTLPTSFARHEALYALAGRADVGELDRHLAEASTLGDENLRHAALQALFSRYAELAPGRALAALKAVAPDDERVWLDSIFSTWSKLDLNGAIEAANRQSDPELRRAAGEAVLRAQRGRPTESLQRIAAQLEDNVEIDEIAAENLVEQARHAPREAIAAALKLTSSDLRNRTAMRIARAWAGSAPADAYAYGAVINDLMARQYFFSGVTARWAEDDPDRALLHVTRAAPSNFLTDHVQVIVRELGRRDPVRALRMADRLATPALIRASRQTVFEAWAEHDINTALQQVEALPDSAEKRELRGSLSHQFARQHPQEAIDWARQMQGPAGRQLFMMVLGIVAESAPERALEAARATDVAGGRVEVLSSVLSMVAWSRPEVAVQHLNELQSGSAHDTAVLQIASAWAERDADAAFAWAETLDGRLGDRARFEIGNQLAYRDPDRAAGYVERLDGQQRDELIVAVAGGFAQHDLARATAWILQFEGEPVHDRVTSGVAQSAAQQDPRAALQLAESITDPDEKSTAINSIVYTWANSDPPAAADYVEGLSDLPTKLAAVQPVANGLAAYDAAAARDWVSGLQPDELRDQGMLGLIPHAGDTPNDYLSLIGAIKTDGARTDAIQQSVQQLAYRDRDAARVLLDRSGASAEQKEALQCFLDDPSNFDSY